MLKGEGAERCDSMSVGQHPIGKSVFLHVYTGVAVMVFRLVTTPYVLAAGFPPVFGGILAFVLVSIPLQLGYMLYCGMKRNGVFSMRGIVVYRQPIRTLQYVILPLPLILAFFAISILTAPASSFLIDRVFWWLPDWLVDPDPILYTDSVGVLWVVFLSVLLIDGIVNPVVEEMYWRGYLMPRLARFGRWAPVINGLLFGLQHFWQPFNYVSIVPSSLLIAYVVWWKKNLYVSVIAHCTVNLIGALVTYYSLLA